MRSFPVSTNNTVGALVFQRPIARVVFDRFGATVALPGSTVSVLLVSLANLSAPVPDSTYGSRATYDPQSDRVVGPRTLGCESGRILVSVPLAPMMVNAVSPDGVCVGATAVRPGSTASAGTGGLNSASCCVAATEISALIGMLTTMSDDTRRSANMTAATRCLLGRSLATIRVTLLPHVERIRL